MSKDGLQLAQDIARKTRILTEQRDALAAALESIVRDYDFCTTQGHYGDRVHAYVETARAALAKVEAAS